MPALLSVSPKACSDRLEIAVQNFVANNIILKNPNYLWSDALKTVGYRSRYIQSHGPEKWKKVVNRIEEYQAKLAVRTIEKFNLTIDWVINEHLEIIKAAKLTNDLPVRTANVKLIGDTIGAYKQGVFDAGDVMTEITEKQRELAALIPDDYLLADKKTPELPAASVEQYGVQPFADDEELNSALSQDASGLTRDGQK